MSLENTGGDKQQLQEMQSMVMKLAAAKAEPVSGGKADTYFSRPNGLILARQVLVASPLGAYIYTYLSC